MIWSIFSGASLLNLVLLFIFTLLGSLGMPGTLVWIVASGALASSISDVIPLIIIVATAAISGDILAYELASKFTAAISSRLLKFKSFQKHEHKARDMLKKSEFSFVFLSRFVFTSIGWFVSYISGLQRINKRKYITAVVLGETLYASLYTLLGFMFKETWLELTSIIKDITWVLVFLLIMGIILRIFYYKK